MPASGCQSTDGLCALCIAMWGAAPGPQTALLVKSLAAAMLAVQNHLLEVDAKKAAGPTWETVRYMVSEIQYGGRITDDFDQLLMDTYAEKYFHQEVTRPNFELYKDERAGISYKIPDSGEIEGFRKVSKVWMCVWGMICCPLWALL